MYYFITNYLVFFPIKQSKFIRYFGAYVTYDPGRNQYCINTLCYSKKHPFAILLFNFVHRLFLMACICAVCVCFFTNFTKRYNAGFLQHASNKA